MASVAPGGPIQFCDVRNSPGRALHADLAAEAGARAARLTNASDNGSSSQALDAEAQGGDAAAHLAQVVARHAFGGGADLVEQKVGERDLGALDARRAQRLLALERRVEQLRVGQLAADAGELAEGGVGARQRQHSSWPYLSLGGRGAGTNAA